MTSIAQNRLNIGLALAIPAAGLVYLASSDFLTMNSSAGAALGLGAVWLAVVLTLNTLRPSGVDRLVRDLANDLVRHRTVTPAHVLDVSRPVVPWRWRDVLLAPVELLAVAWTVPIVILVIMVPIGLAVMSALWLGRLILDRI